MSKGNKEARISARVHPSVKEGLESSGYNAREAIEYFNSIVTNKIDALKIEEHFLNKEIEDLKEELIIKERRLGIIQKEIDNVHIDRVSSLRVDSYQKLIDLYNLHSNNESFEEFINGSYIKDEYIVKEVHKFPDCDMDTYCLDLIKYYDDVILVGKTF